LLRFAEYLALFAAAFLSVLPFQSDVVLLGMLVTERYSWLLLVLVASAGNTLACVINWLLGRCFAHLEELPWFPLTRTRVIKAEEWYQRYGRWSLLLTGLPFMSDPLTIVAGMLREPLPAFILLVGLAKLLRHLAVAAVSFGWMSAIF
jgi:membrane protein YqaA with SNARE-associated domain